MCVVSIIISGDRGGRESWKGREGKGKEKGRVATKAGEGKKRKSWKALEWLLSYLLASRKEQQQQQQQQQANHRRRRQEGGRGGLGALSLSLSLSPKKGRKTAILFSHPPPVSFAFEISTISS